MVEMLSDAYKCKWIKVDDYKKTDSLPGLWTYVAQYEFNLTFADGEAGAIRFMKGLYNTVPGETDWQKVLQNPNARAYIRDNCSPPAQKTWNRSLSSLIQQLADKKNATVKTPCPFLFQDGRNGLPVAVDGQWTCGETRSGKSRSGLNRSNGKT